MFLFVWREELVDRIPTAESDTRGVVRDVFGDMTWEVPGVLDRMDEVKDIYFDRVSQIRMDHWTNGRVALLGDAAACVSLLAGEGAGLAMTEAYVLAGELHRAAGDHTVAFQTFETKLRPLLADKQKSALRFGGFFAPKNRLGLFLRDLATNLAGLPFLAKLLIGQALNDEFTLPDYRSPADPS
jgi:2-polyprenyl-6-methoxyphenol hydroxylase-like FAD-dependent oxidoreductase